MPIWIYLGKGSRESEEQKGPLDQLLQNQCLVTRKMKQPAIKQHQRLFCDVIKGLCELTRYLHTQLKNRVLNHHHENSEPIPSNYAGLKLRPNPPKSFNFHYSSCNDPWVKLWVSLCLFKLFHCINSICS